MQGPKPRSGYNTELCYYLGEKLSKVKAKQAEEEERKKQEKAKMQEDPKY
ncbi:uncharacterized protein FRV6_14334 [Fusarium oxysporum]|uniref:Uncharacterized protein n=1 Tax=Fusarium oxysporum TaxID=5507 RepID=A0A2H3U403_FUSOX|nr:uncharacterized protein FRV6_14334 [Fusarium oxysporum]